LPNSIIGIQQKLFEQFSHHFDEKFGLDISNYRYQINFPPTQRGCQENMENLTTLLPEPVLM
jgi:hypothetical protein